MLGLSVSKAQFFFKVYDRVERSLSYLLLSAFQLQRSTLSVCPSGHCHHDRKPGKSKMLKLLLEQGGEGKSTNVDTFSDDNRLRGNSPHFGELISSCCAFKASKGKSPQRDTESKI